MSAHLTPAELERNRSGLARGRDVMRERRAGRIEDYLFIGGDKLFNRQAAERLGVTMRTITRYRRALREMS
jgi:predicted DNA-binding transcriptional regulator YafY